MQQLPALPSLWWGLLLVPLAALAWRRPFWLIAVLFVAGVAWASLRAGWILEEELPRELEGRNLLVEGHIADIPGAAEHGFRFELDVLRAEADGVAVRIPSRVLLHSAYELFQPRAGEAWRLLVRLKRPHGYQNPGGFDYEGHLFRQRLRAKGYVRADLAPQRLESAALRYGVDRLRDELGRRIRALMPEHPFAGVIVALANGDARGIGEPQWRVLRASGTVHLVAISGLHISLIAGVVFFLARFLWALPGTTVLRVPAPVFGAVSALAAAAAYAALAGFVVPAQRALIMLAVAMSGIVLRRRFPPAQVLAAALLLVLLYDPLSAMAAGFWLSFAAVAVILFVAHEESAGSRLRRFGTLQLAITLGLLPLMLALFQQVSLSAPLANLLAVPVFDFAAVPLTLGGIVALGVLPEAVAGALFQAAGWLMQLLWPAIEALARLEYSQWTQPQPPLWTLACAIAGILWLLAPRGWPARWVGAVWLLPMLLVRPPGPAAGEVWLTLLDVGQGLSAVVRTQNHVLVFDAGPRFGPAFDTGAAVVVPYLRAVGVGRIDTLVVSHADNDHQGGVASLLAALPTERVLSSVAGLAAPAQPCEAGQAWRWDGVEFAMLNPTQARFSRRNDDSCVLRVQSPHGALLLPADIEARAERRLIERYGAGLAADVLIAPHHGSRSSSTAAFIEAVRPRHVLFPVGYRNRHRHPHPEVVARYAAAGARLHDSPASGALELRLRATGIEDSAYRREHRRYWYAGGSFAGSGVSP